MHNVESNYKKKPMVHSSYMGTLWKYYKLKNTASFCWFDFLQLYFLPLSTTLCYLCYKGEHNEIEWIWIKLWEPKENCQPSNSSGKKSISLGGPVLSFSCKSKFLGSTSSVSWPAKEKYLSSTICSHKR